MAASNDIWVIAETDAGRLQEVSLEALGEAREQADRVRGAVTAVVCGPAGDDLVSHLGKYGADRVLLSAGSAEHARSAERCAAVLAHALERETPRLVLLGATVLGRDIACRVAAARNLALANDCNWVRLSPDGGIEAARIVYGGKLYARVRIRSAPALASLRPGATGVGKPVLSRVEGPVLSRAEGPVLSRVEGPSARQPAVSVLPSLDSVPARVERAAFVKADPRTVDIAEADRIVAVGRGIGERARLESYQRLADHLGAALAASRPLVDAGWLPFERQVGQTGRIVAPRLYIAAGISGASQHTLGMRASECVVAINRDKGAEIFKLANLKVLADLETLMPELLRRLNGQVAR